MRLKFAADEARAVQFYPLTRRHALRLVTSNLLIAYLFVVSSATGRVSSAAARTVKRVRVNSPPDSTPLSALPCSQGDQIARHCRLVAIEYTIRTTFAAAIAGIRLAWRQWWSIAGKVHEDCTKLPRAMTEM
jgi:hypothetical protein